MSLPISRTAAALVALIAIEALVFFTQLADQILPYYPMNFDQTSYINNTFRLLDAIRDRGWLALAHVFIRPPAATGTGLIAEGAVLALVAGPSRASLASLNLIYLVAFQLTLYWTVRTRTGSSALAWTAVALLLSSATIFLPAGGIFDFRADFSTFCLYGIWTCLLVRYRAIARGWFPVGAVGALLILTRFVTVLYVAGVLAGLLVCAFTLIKWSPRGRAPREIASVRNICRAGALTAILSLPFLTAAAPALYGKYVVGHVLTSEKYMRAEEMGIRDILGHILFYPRSILQQHIGSFGLWLIALLVGVSIVGAVWRREGTPRSALRRLWYFRLELLALALSIIIPLSILTVDIAKSPIVGGIVVGPVLLTVVLLCGAIWPNGWRRRTILHLSRPSARHGNAVLHRHWTSRPAGTAVVAVIVMVLAIAEFLVHGSADQRQMSRLELERIREVTEAIAQYAVENEILEPRMAIDRVVDYLNIGTIELEAFERFGRRLTFRAGLDYDFMPTPRDVALDIVGDSDIVVLTDPVLGRAQPYPMNVAIREYWDDMRKLTIQRAVPLISRDILGIPHQVYVRPGVKILGTSAGWMTSAGVTLEVDSSYLQRWPFIFIEGAANYDVLGGEPRPSAVVVDPAGGPGTALPVKLKRVGYRYEIVIDGRGASPMPGPVKVHLTFDRFFVPSKLGINADTRELVLSAPTRRELRVTAE